MSSFGNHPNNYWFKNHQGVLKLVGVEKQDIISKYFPVIVFNYKGKNSDFTAEKPKRHRFSTTNRS